MRLFVIFAAVNITSHLFFIRCTSIGGLSSRNVIRLPRPIEHQITLGSEYCIRFKSKASVYCRKIPSSNLLHLAKYMANTTNQAPSSFDTDLSRKEVIRV
jgi:hypothetical protein